MKKLIITITLLVVICSMALAQRSFLDPEPQIPSADTWDFIHYGEIEPSLYTGTMALSVPFYIYEDADFRIPISFDYASNGCIPNILAGVLGPGWQLNVGGCVSREIRGIPDNRDIAAKLYGFYRLYQERPNYPKWYIGHSDVVPKSPANLWYYDSVNASYDADPDFFHFNFMGISGRFHLGFDGQMFVYDTNINPEEVKIEITMDTPGWSMDAFCEIIFTTADGYRYIFNSANGHDMSNLDYIQAAAPGSSPQEIYFQIQTWHLSRIEAPNGRVVDFTYSRRRETRMPRPNTLFSIYEAQGHGSWTYGGNTTMSSTEYYYRNALLSTIRIDGADGTEIRFSYSNGPQEKSYANCYNTSSSEINDGGSPRLSGIEVINGNRTISSCTLSYITANSTSNMRFLQNINITGQGSYTMQYDGLSIYPAYNCFGIDHWGYYNNRAQDGSFLNVSTLNLWTMDENLDSLSVRTPNHVVAGTGMLTRITYPTGGYTTMEYEPHRFGKAVMRLSLLDFRPSLHSDIETAECGGFRIKRLRNYDSDHTLLNTREFRYVLSEDRESESGILVHYPRYWANYKFKVYNTNYFDWALVYSNNLVNYEGTHIEYPEVQEIVADGSGFQYYFTSTMDYPDYCSPMKTHLDYPEDWPALDINEQELRYYNSVTQQPVSLQGLRGKLKKRKTCNSDWETLIDESHSFLDDDIYAPISYDTIPEHMFALINMSAVFVGRIDQYEETTTSYYNNGNRALTTKKTYGYNGGRQISSISEIGSAGEKYLKTYTYVTDSRKDAVEAAMLAANVIAYPTAERTYVDSLLSSEVVYYFCHPDSTKARLFRVGEKHERDLVTNTWHITKYSYDKNGNILEVINPDGRKTCYLWGYRGMYPVAVIEGCGLRELKNTTGFSAIEDGPFVGGLPASVEAILRSSAPQGSEVATYEYEPLVGLVKATGPDGRKMEYSYNNAGKLMGVYDNAMRLRESYYYSTENK